MVKPRGFSKNYFSLSAIQAYSTASTIASQITRIHSLTKNSYEISCERADEEESPPDELLSLVTAAKPKASHCNCFYNLKAKLAVAIFHFIPRCPFYCTFFAFRRSGIHPPFTI